MTFVLWGCFLLAQTDSQQIWIVQSQEAIKNDNLKQSLALGKKAFDAAQAEAIPFKIGQAALNLGNIYRSEGDLAQAEETLNLAVHYFEILGPQERYARSLAELGRIKQAQRNFPAAVELYTKALSIYNKQLSAAEATKNLDLKGFILERMGVIESNQKQYEQAQNYLHEAYNILTQIDDKSKLEITCTSLGNNYFWLKNYEKAGKYYQKAYDLSLLIGRNTGRSLNNLGIIANKSGNSDKAISYYRQAIEQYKKANSKDLIAQTQINIGELYRGKSNFQKAIEFTQQGTEGVLALHKTTGLVEGYEILLKSFIHIGDTAKALEYLKRFDAIKDSFYVNSREKEMLELEKKFETEKKDKDIQLLNQQNTIYSKNNDLLRGAIVTMLLFGLLGWFFYRYRQGIVQERAHIARLRAEEASERHWQETELRALRSQMNPHFIFNCLNAIKSLTLKNETDKASIYITKFSRLMRQVLENSRSEWISLSQELETLSLYLEMEKLRFQTKFEYQLDVSPDLSLHGIQVPPMLIQPYVENAIWHGLMHKEGNGKVTVSVEENDDNQLIVKIIDNGIGRKRSSELKSKSATEKKSFGLQITSERMDILNQYYHIKATIHIKDLVDDLGNPSGTEACLMIPL
jgi:tetratricopeptide (TPR) repeat protein/two-component sensor histidine kinase